MINSEFLNGLDINEATDRIMDFLEKKGYGKRQTTYHLRDWLISRQRYWGPPIPMIYCEKCASEGVGEQKEMPGWYSVQDKDLPIELPYIEDFKPLGTGQSPLGNHPEFYKVKCPHCKASARRETDVSDTFLDSAWYFLRYTSTEDKTRPWIPDRVLKWLPVDMYIGGAEHSVLHLLYARFISMVFKDLSLISNFEEPFSRFYAHGLIIKEGAKMSKSKGNVVGPDIYIKKFGADTLRMYLHFLSPFNQDGDFRDSGIEGMHRFLKKIWKLFSEVQISNDKSQMTKESVKMMHQTIKNVTVEIENLRFNTSIAYLMSYYNFLAKQDSLSREEIEVYLKLLAPFAPHISEELFNYLHNSKLKNTSNSIDKQSLKFESIHLSAWPKYDQRYLVSDTVTIPVQVNGKLRGLLQISADQVENKLEIEGMARKDKKVAKFLGDKKIKKVIYVPGKVVSILVG